MIDEVLKSLGITADMLRDAFDGFDTDFVIGSPDDVGAIVGQIAPGLDPAVKADLANAIYAGTAPIERAYATATAALITESQLRSNSAVTLFAGNAGSAQVPGTVYPLQPRTAGTLTGANFKFTKTMSFHRATADPRDAALLFYLVGNTFGFENERAKVFPNDTGLSMFRPEIDVLQTPVASLVGRSPDADRDFTASIVLGGTENAEFGGLTIVFSDTECRAADKYWQANLSEFDFAELANHVMSTVSRPRPMPVITRNPNKLRIPGKRKKTLPSLNLAMRR